MTKEDRREITVKGLFLALILFMSMLIDLLILRDMQHLQVVGTFLIPIIAFYCLLGMFIQWMVYRSTLRKKEFHLLSGTAAIYWICMLSIIFMVCAHWVPQVIRYIVVANGAALLLVWFLDYLYMKKIANELNSGLEYYSRVLVEDLPARPKTEDMFMEEISNYCKKNHLSLEILEYGIPAKIKMNNIQYMVKLGQYYTLVGILVYTLEFHNMISKIKNSST
ncbi:DUF4318 domain-containing protein [Clostridium sp. OS1-26]|uniref:DUF4318 domain-containing protein n=1 Tax=Clostridium sp. OS1-26 TaxID=3070681 RepID=UPI0027E07CF0|nr:DUF4318 domain-containing protein [Clostridium sp. OS1-26]WML32792.1 DUF4318 domain-containing protein [Clostridium sp. OS1-26]